MIHDGRHFAAWVMNWERLSPLGLLIVSLLLATNAWSKQNSAKDLVQLSKQNRVELEHAFTSDLVYARTGFPMGKDGLSLRNGQITPNGPALQQVIDASGLAAQRGDLVQITGIAIKEDHIRFEINGGPEKSSRWYQKITVYGPGGTPVQVKPNKPGGEVASARRGSFVDLYFENTVHELTVGCLKELLRPAFDFAAKSSLEAYLDTVPPAVQQAIKDHHVLVGMNREMLLYAKGLPKQKIREKSGETEYEDWVYGEPPQDVDFVRVINNEVVRVETMKVDGEKIIRTEREIEPQTSSGATTKEQDQSEPQLNSISPNGSPCGGKTRNSALSDVPDPGRWSAKAGNPFSNCAFR